MSEREPEDAADDVIEDAFALLIEVLPGELKAEVAAIRERYIAALGEF